MPYSEFLPAAEFKELTMPSILSLGLLLQPLPADLDTHHHLGQINFLGPYRCGEPRVIRGVTQRLVEVRKVLFNLCLKQACGVVFQLDGPCGHGSYFARSTP